MNPQNQGSVYSAPTMEEGAPPPVLPNQQMGPQPNVPSAPPAPPKKPFSRKIFLFLGLFILGVVLFFGITSLLPRLGGGGEVTLTWWGLWEDENIIAPIITEYEASHANVKINYIKQSPTDYRERLMSALAGEGGPDIFRFHNTWVPMFSGSLDNVPSTAYSAAEFDQTFYPVATTDLTSGAGIVGIPLEYDGLTLFINTEIFTAAGKEAPNTWDDVRKLAKELTVKDERGIIVQSGIALGRTENVDHWPEILALMMIQNRANPARPTGELAAKALEFFTAFSRIDKVWDETLPPSTSAFAAGKLAMYLAPSWRAFEVQQANPNLKFSTVNLPQIPKDNASEPNITYATYWVEGVSNKSANRTAAWEFLKFVSQKETLEKLYSAGASVRGFGEPYPRVEMAGTLATHPVLGSIIALAPEAKSWYLASNTNDGPTGINSQLAEYFKNAVNAVNAGTPALTALETTAAGVSQILSVNTNR